jgi:hypothetical protein
LHRVNRVYRVLKASMSKKTKKKSTTSSVSVSSLPSELPPAQTQPPSSKTAPIEADDCVPPTESDVDASRRILGDVYSECCSALNVYLSDSQNVGLVELSRFFKCAYELGRSKSAGVFKELSEEIPRTVAREREEARVQGVTEGKRAERLRMGMLEGRNVRLIGMNVRPLLSKRIRRNLFPYPLPHQPPPPLPFRPRPSLTR